MEARQGPQRWAGARARLPKRRRASTPVTARRVRPRAEQHEHPAVHQWEPLPLQAHTLRQRGRGSIPWAARCKRCQAQVSGTARWFSQLTEGCQAEVQSSLAKHVVVPAAGGYACQRCALPIRPDRRHLAAEARCLVPATDPPNAAFAAACRYERARLQAFVEWVRPPAVGQEARAPQAEAPVPPPPVAGFLPAYAGHHILPSTTRGLPLCIKCGCMPRSQEERAGRCQLSIPLPGRAVEALESGRFDRALLTGPVWALERAQEVGYRPVPVSPGHGLPP